MTGWQIVVLLLPLILSEATMLGGYKKKTNFENDARTQEVANFAVAEIGKKKGSDVKLERIVDVSTQVVAGLNYQLLLQLDGGDNVEAVVYEPLGNKPLELTSYKEVGKDKAVHQEEAAQERGTEATLGQFAEVSSSDEDVKKAANFALQVLSSASNSLYPLNLKEIVKAAKRTGENGQEYQMDLLLSQQGVPDKVMSVKVLQPLGGTYQLQSSSEKV
eukprot:jgi/Botrbrau1/6544/Bobra.40_2s0015.1